MDDELVHLWTKLWIRPLVDLIILMDDELVHL